MERMSRWKCVVIFGTPVLPLVGPKSATSSAAGGASRFRVVRLHARGGLGQVSVAIDEELRRHLALAVQDRIDRGETPEAARRAALIEFGNLHATREDVRRV